MSKGLANQKIRRRNMALQVLGEQNYEISKIQSQLILIVEQKERQLQLKQIEIKKYRQQILEAFTKNQEITNFCRKLSNQYYTLLNSMKDNQAVALLRQQSANSKIKILEKQLNFYRQNTLLKKITSTQSLTIKQKAFVNSQAAKKGKQNNIIKYEKQKKTNKSKIK